MRLLHRHGFGIQSPWAYHLVTDVLFDKSQFYAYESLKATHPGYFRQGERLFRLVNELKPHNAAIVTSDITSPNTRAAQDYMRAASHTLTVSVVSDTPFQHHSMLVVQSPSLFNLADWLTRGLVSDDVVIIVDDISHEGASLWQQLLDEPTSTATFDIARTCGIAFFDSKRTKQAYRV